MKTVKEIIKEWEKKIEELETCIKTPTFPKGIYFFEGEAFDRRAFKKLLIKYNIPDTNYYIAKDAIYFRI
jgi:hypothetical protein